MIWFNFICFHFTPCCDSTLWELGEVCLNEYAWVRQRVCEWVCACLKVSPFSHILNTIHIYVPHSLSYFSPITPFFIQFSSSLAAFRFISFFYFILFYFILFYFSWLFPIFPSFIFHFISISQHPPFFSSHYFFPLPFRP